MAVISWRQLLKSSQSSAAHALLFSFTLLVALKLDHAFYCSWWFVFFPLWLFHAVVARGRFSFPAPSAPYDRHWAPCHSVVATPLLIAFELLLCIYLESSYVYHVPAVNLKFVFLPVVFLEIIILIDNSRMCNALMPANEERVTEDVIWEIIPHLLISVSMIFILTATIMMVLKLTDFPSVFRWWDLFMNVSIGQCFAFFVCTKWSNPLIHRHPQTIENGSSSMTIGFLDWSSGLVVQSEEEQNQGRLCCSLQDIGGHVMKVLIVVFQILLCMYLEGTPARAKEMPILFVVSPLFLLQGVGVLFSTLQLLERTYLLFRNKAGDGQYFVFSSKVHDFLEFLLHGSRFLGWWSIDEGSKEEQAHLLHEDGSKYNTFLSYPPHIVKKMPKRELTEEVWRLQTALGQQTEITKFSQQMYERIQNLYQELIYSIYDSLVVYGDQDMSERVLCRICFDKEINIVLLPCRHRVLCSTCSEKCEKCPICRVSVEEQMLVYDV